MTRERLQTILGAYGADPARWPVGERAAAERFLATSPATRRYRDDLARLDAKLDELPLPSANPLDTTILTARIVAMPQRDPLRHPVEWLVRAIGLRGPAAAGFALAAALAGFVVGWGYPEPAAGDETLAGLFPVSSSEIDTSW